jgi:hypothetical protein
MAATQYELIRDYAGNILLPGKVQKTLTWTPGIDDVSGLPSWLTCSSGTATIVQGSSSAAGECQLESPSGGEGSLITTDTFDLSLFEAIYLQVFGLHTTDSNLSSYTLTINGNDTGGAYHVMLGSGASSYVKQNTAEGTGGQVDVPFNVTNTTGWEACSYDVGLLVMVRTGIVYCLEDDQVYGVADYSGGSASAGTLLTGAVRPSFNNSASSSVQTTAHIKSMSLTFAQY